jgi:hypothetical protein
MPKLHNRRYATEAPVSVQSTINLRSANSHFPSTGCLVTMQIDRALAVEMRGRLVLVESGKDRCKRIAPVQNAGCFVCAAVHEHMENRILSEERHLSFGVTPISSVGICIDQGSDCQPISRFLRVQCRGHDQSFLAYLFGMSIIPPCCPC